jgi:hypothetical protein
MLPIVQTIKLKVSLKNTTQIVKSEYVGTVVDQNKIGQSVTLDSFTIQRFV